MFPPVEEADGIVEQLSLKFRGLCAFCDKSVKIGTDIENDILKKIRSRGISNFASGDL